MRGHCFLLLATLLLPFAAPGAAEEEIWIGVLSHRGEAATLSVWTPTADYLSASLDGYRFTIVPLAFDRVNGAVDSGEVDFILVNPGDLHQPRSRVPGFAHCYHEQSPREQRPLQHLRRGNFFAPGQG